MSKTSAIRACVFCGSPADSREHVFAKRLCSRAGADNYPVIAGLSVEGKEDITRPAHIVQNVQVRHVCADCNNNWMEKLESWFELRLGFLIEPDWPGFALAGIIEALKSEREKLAQWLMKTAIMFNLASVQGGEYPVKFSSAVTRKIKEGILPENCWVDLAYSKSVPTKVGGTITRHFNVINGAEPVQNKVLKTGDGFKFVVQFNHLLLSIAQAPSTNVHYHGRGQVPVRLYPTPKPLPNDFTYENIAEFQHCVVLRTWKDCRGNIT